MHLVYVQIYDKDRMYLNVLIKEGFISINTNSRKVSNYYNYYFFSMYVKL